MRSSSGSAGTTSTNHRPTRLARSACCARGQGPRAQHADLANLVGRWLVLVVPADPELERIALVAAFRHPVEDPVVAHQELDPARPGRIGVVDGPVIQDEGAEALALGQVPNYVGAALAGIALGDRRQGLDYRRDPLARLLLAARVTEVEVELTVG